jgi:hypothetical protein
MTQTAFDPDGELILVNAELWGPLGSEVLTLAVDTAAVETIILPEVLGRLGYSIRQAVQRTRVVSAVGVEPGFTIHTARFSALGFEKNDFLVHAHDLGEDAGFDGLLGLSFLRSLNYEIRSVEGRIIAAPAVAA